MFFVHRVVFYPTINPPSPALPVPSGRVLTSLPVFLLKLKTLGLPASYLAVVRYLPMRSMLWGEGGGSIRFLVSFAGGVQTLGLHLSISTKAQT